MKAFIFLFLATIVSALTIDSIPVGAEVIEAPFTTRLNKRWAKDKWGNNPEPHRRKVTIRASKNDYDDVSNDFLWAMKKANHGGLVHLEESKTYVIGKRLDLSWLDDIYVRLDGEIKVWGGKNIKIYGSGTLNGNGQAWYDGFAEAEILDPTNSFYRPILFLTDNATNVDISGIRFLNSPCWNTFLVRTKDISFDRCRFDAFSTNASYCIIWLNSPN
ncbi:glycoside hydrolase family 28 protein [Glonium stellatum]|uniref:galacturonan 1,4-alpha-galacturonidase n=1 Tax=Glonium stellatum TaxID=574774 RepID=A0A8E2JY00_9PEZI|nr:glycoside hydrolase family 28 protein [Glonium stellatum]